MMLRAETLELKRRGLPALSFPDFSLAAGERFLILGPSGSGKTSLLFILAGLLKPSSGQVLFDGRVLPRKEEERAQNFGFVFQNVHLIGHLTVAQNIALSFSGARKPKDSARIETLIRALDLEGYANRRAQDLSHGQAQRVDIARSLAHSPRVIFADEPTSALDDRNTERVMDVLSAQAKACGAALIVCTHDARIKPLFSRHMELV